MNAETKQTTATADKSQQTTSAPPPIKRTYNLATFPTDLRSVNRKECHDYTKHAGIFSYLALPEKDDQEGLFLVGELNLIAAPQGVGRLPSFCISSGCGRKARSFSDARLATATASI